MATRNPPEDICTYLAAQGLGLTYGTNLFSTYPRLDPRYPAPCVFVWDGVSAAPVNYLGMAESLWQPAIQVLVRGANEGFQTARNLARDIRDTLNRAQVSGYVSLVARESAPINLGQANSAQPEFSLNFEVLYRE